MTQYAWVFGILSIIGGVFFTYFGRKLFMAALFLIGLVMTVFLILLVFYSTFLKANTEQWVAWVVLVVATLMGLGVGFLFTKLVRFGAAILAGWGGFILGMLVNEMWLYMYGNSYLFWSVNCGTAVVCAILAFCMFNYAVMISTAFLGSFFICRGISYWAGGFPAGYQLVQQVQSGAIDLVDPVIYAYLAGIALLTVTGCVVQIKMFKSMNEEDQKPPYERIN
jgi:hypothetical protein